MPGIQVAPSSGQNWLSSSSHGGATERCQVFKWRHLPDKTGYHHHMVAPLSGARSSSGAIFRTKLVSSSSHGGATERCPHSSGAIFIQWWRPLIGARYSSRHLPDKTGSSSSSHGGATDFSPFCCHFVAILRHFFASGAIFRTKLVIIIIITWWRH